MRYLGPYIRFTDNRKFMVIVRDDGSKSTISYARYLMLLKTPLKDNEDVDHIDEDRTNDSEDNLQVLTHIENTAKTKRHLSKGRRTETRWCGFCGKEIQKEIRNNRKGGLVFCSKQCNGKVNH